MRGELENDVRRDSSERWSVGGEVSWLESGSELRGACLHVGVK